MEKSKNDQKTKRPYRKIAMSGCLVLFLLGAVGIFLFMARFDAWHTVYGAAIDLCMGQIGNVHPDFQLAGHIVDAQGQSIVQANVKLNGSGVRECDERITSYSTITNVSGEFLFGPDLFEYEKEFFISANADGCQTSMIYDDPAPNEPVTIVLDCAIPSSTQETS